MNATTICDLILDKFDSYENKDELIENDLMTTLSQICLLIFGDEYLEKYDASSVVNGQIQAYLNITKDYFKEHNIKI